MIQDPLETSQYSMRSLLNPCISFCIALKTVACTYKAVVSENDLCSRIGARILSEGGSGVDSAIAMTLCIGVTNPFSAGLAGGSCWLGTGVDRIS